MWLGVTVALCGGCGCNSVCSVAGCEYSSVCCVVGCECSSVCCVVGCECSSLCCVVGCECSSVCCVVGCRCISQCSSVGCGWKRFTQCWVRKHVQKFPHTCTYRCCHTVKCTVTHHFGSCIQSSWISVMEFVRSEQLRQLTVMADVGFALAPATWLQTIRYLS